MNGIATSEPVVLRDIACAAGEIIGQPQSIDIDPETLDVLPCSLGGVRLEPPGSNSPGDRRASLRIEEARRDDSIGARPEVRRLERPSLRNDELTKADVSK